MMNGKERILKRAFEIFPGALAWATLFGIVFFSWAKPILVAIFIIVFDVYWLLKTLYLTLHLRASWQQMKHHLAIDWRLRLENVKWDHVWQLVILPTFEESHEVLEGACEALLRSSWPRERMMVVLATEERAGERFRAEASRIREKYGSHFAYFLITKHPANKAGEIPGKGANITWAASRAKEEIIDRFHLSYKQILVSSFDIDTQVYPQYFLCLTYHFLTAESPHRSSYQPIPIYNNNIWDAPAISRVVATSGTFWQMMQQARPERLTTFSSHSMSFATLLELGYWETNVVSEDSRIFWNALLHFNGDYRVVPLFYPVSMDANLAPTFWETVKNVYRQQRRWTWGVENIPYLLFGFWRARAIPLRRRFYFIFIQTEGFWSLATNPLILFLLGWLPLVFGGDIFNTTAIAYNLPRITRLLMTLAMFGLVGSAIISTALLPPVPTKYKKTILLRLSMVFQWLLVPVTIIIFGALPGLDSQTRLMLGGKWRLGFWVTPKHRRH